MFGLLAVYFIFFSPEPPLPEEVVDNQEQPSNKTTPTTETTQESQPQAIPDSILAQMNSQEYGVFSFAANGNGSDKTMENEDLKITFSSQGGQITDVILKNHKDYMGNPLVLIDGEKTKSELIVDQAGKKINLSELNFNQPHSK